jgi:hypothetical protein
MGADEVAVIRPALLELEAALTEPVGDSGPLCASFEVEPTGSPWLQVVFGSPDTLNVYYPFGKERPPLDWIRQLRTLCLAQLRLTGHEPGVYATFSFSRPSPMELARFLDEVFVQLLESKDEYPLTVKLFRMAK